jgi:hypothetical protein
MSSQTPATPDAAAGLERELAAARSRLATLTADATQRRADTERLQAKLGRAFAAGRDATAIQRELRDTRDALEGLESGRDQIAETLEALEQQHRQAQIAEAEAAQRRAEDAAIAAVAALDRVIRQCVQEVILPAWTATTETGGEATRAAEVTQRLRGRGPTPGYVSRVYQEAWHPRQGLLALVSNLQAYATGEADPLPADAEGHERDAGDSELGRRLGLTAAAAS